MSLISVQGDPSQLINCNLGMLNMSCDAGQVCVQTAFQDSSHLSCLGFPPAIRCEAAIGIWELPWVCPSFIPFRPLVSHQHFQSIKRVVFNPILPNVFYFFCPGFLLVNLILDESLLPLNILLTD